MNTFLQNVYDLQKPHPAWPRIGLRAGSEAGRIVMELPSGEREVPAAEALQALEMRARIIADAERDPYRHGYEPACWREADWMIAELRVRHQMQPVTLDIQGGNGSAKTFYAAARMAMAVCENEHWLVIQLATDEKQSREVAQQWTYHYLPEEMKTMSGKMKKTRATKMSYNKAGGFTDNTFSLENRSQTNFMFYSSDVKSMEGPRPDFVWADEEVPVNFWRTAIDRLTLKAGLTQALISQLKEALRVRAEKGDAAGYALLRPLLPRLMQGVCLITFTPKSGWTPTIAALQAGAVTVEEREAELFPLPDGRCERVPVRQFNDGERAGIIYFHVYENPWGNWDGMKLKIATASRKERLWKAYGVALRSAGVQFPLFSHAAHVRPLDRLPAEGTWYHIIDPCPGRNWFMIWAKVAPNPMGEPLIFVAREWPQPGDFIQAGGIGDPGEWALPSTGRKKDGEKGEAQQPFGFGFDQYVAEIRRVEEELFRKECQLLGGKASEGGRIRVASGCRIMDSRAAGAKMTTQADSITLIEMLAKYDLDVLAAGREAGAPEGTTTIKEGVQLVVDRLSYDAQAAVVIESGGMEFRGKAPSLIVAESCANLIFALGNWTGQDGLTGACKDPVDVLRYLVNAGPEHVCPQDYVAWDPYHGAEEEEGF